MKVFTLIDMAGPNPIVLSTYSTMEAAQRNLAKYMIAEGIDFVDCINETWGKTFFGSYEGEKIRFEIQRNFLDYELECM